MSSSPLHVQSLHKRFGARVVLEDVSLKVEPAQVWRIAGGNGAGKSTLLGCIAGTLIPDSGETLIAGHSLRDAPIDARAALRYLPQAPPTPLGVSGREILTLYAELFDASGDDVTRVAEDSCLGDAIDELVSTYSGGMRQRLMFHALRFGCPALVVLDEPFAGVDRSGRTAFREQIDRWLAGGAGVVLATHEPDDPALDGLATHLLELETG